MPKISIIIPTYNRSEFLTTAIASALNQTHKNLEIIVINDNPVKSIEKGIKEFKNGRIKYLEHPKNKGVSATRNTGIQSATGEYIFFLDDDDFLEPTALEKLINKFSTTPLLNVGLVYCWQKSINQDNGEIVVQRNNFMETGYCFNAMLQGTMPFPIRIMVKKEVFHKTGLFDESLSRCEDYDIVLRIAQHCQFDIVPEFLYFYRRHHQGNLSDLTNVEHAKNYQKTLNKHLAFFKHQTKALAKHFLILGYLFCCSNHLKKGRGYLMKSIKTNPLNWKGYLLLILTLGGRRFFYNVMLWARNIILYKKLNK